MPKVEIMPDGRGSQEIAPGTTPADGVVERAPNLHSEPDLQAHNKHSAIGTLAAVRQGLRDIMNPRRLLPEGAGLTPPSSLPEKNLEPEGILMVGAGTGTARRRYFPTPHFPGLGRKPKTDLEQPVRKKRSHRLRNSVAGALMFVSAATGVGLVTSKGSQGQTGETPPPASFPVAGQSPDAQPSVGPTTEPSPTRTPYPFASGPTGLTFGVSEGVGAELFGFTPQLPNQAEAVGEISDPRPTTEPTVPPTPKTTATPTTKPTTEPTPVITEKPPPKEVKIDSRGYMTLLANSSDKPYYNIRLVKPTVISEPKLQKDGSVLIKVALPGNKITATDCSTYFFGDVCEWKGGRFNIIVKPDDPDNELDGTWITNASGFTKFGDGPDGALKHIRKGDTLSIIDIDPIYNKGDEDYQSAKDLNENWANWVSYKGSTGDSGTKTFTFKPYTIGVFSPRT